MKRIRQKVLDIKLASLNHKINRKAMILNEIDFCSYLYNDYKVIDKLEEAFTETVKMPVGGYVRRYINL